MERLICLRNFYLVRENKETDHRIKIIIIIIKVKIN